MTLVVAADLPPQRVGVQRWHSSRWRWSKPAATRCGHSRWITVISGWLPVRIVGPHVPAPLEV